MWTFLVSVITIEAGPGAGDVAVWPSPIKIILSLVASPPSIKAFKAQAGVVPGVYSISITGPVVQVVPAVLATI